MQSRQLKTNNINVDVNPKEKMYLSASEQLEICLKYTQVYKNNLSESVQRREIECLKVIFPACFRPKRDNDLILGRFEAMPVGFGSVTSIGAPGHYGRIDKLTELKKHLPLDKHVLVDELISYWQKNDTREKFYKTYLKDATVGKFVDVTFPAIATARLSGMYLNYNLLLDCGIDGLKSKIQKNKFSETSQVMLEALELLQITIDHHINEIKDFDDEHHTTLRDALINIKTKKPSSFLEAIQLSWLYSCLSGVVNYGRMDDYLGDYYCHDIDNKIITEKQASEYLKSLWRLIEVKRTNVNGRVIVGGLGRRNPEFADRFCLLAIKVTEECNFVEPQFTLRTFKGMNQNVFDAALMSISKGTTYPILYNDDVNVKAVMNSMNVDYNTAIQYVPFGCGEFVISGQGIGTPNTCVNLLKVLTIFIHDGIDLWDGITKIGDFKYKNPENINTFDEFFKEFKKFLYYYFNKTGYLHKRSYDVLAENNAFIFTSILTDDCIGRNKMLFEGGVKYIGGTNEMYGNINTSDSLAAIKKLVFDDKKYSFSELKNNLATDFELNPKMRQEMLEVPKFGNDNDFVDNLAIELHDFVCQSIKEIGAKFGFDSWLVVVINNQVNTEWGRATVSSPDGRITGLYMANAINPQSGFDTSGLTSMLNSLLKLKADNHAGSVQNLKLTPDFIKNNFDITKKLIEIFFESGGPQIMITCVNKNDLENALLQPQKYQNLMVRVGGFSAKFVNLEPDVQEEILHRTLNE